MILPTVPAPNGTPSLAPVPPRASAAGAPRAAIGGDSRGIIDAEGRRLRTDPAHGLNVNEDAENQLARGEAMLRLHAADLVLAMQRWAAELEDRQTQLNAQAAQQDKRERAFRLWMAETSALMAQQQAEVTAEQDRLRAAVRRAVIAEMGSAP